MFVMNIFLSVQVYNIAFFFQIANQRRNLSQHFLASAMISSSPGTWWFSMMTFPLQIKVCMTLESAE